MPAIFLAQNVTEVGRAISAWMPVISLLALLVMGTLMNKMRQEISASKEVTQLEKDLKSLDEKLDRKIDALVSLMNGMKDALVTMKESHKDNMNRIEREFAQSISRIEKDIALMKRDIEELKVEKVG